MDQAPKLLDEDESKLFNVPLIEKSFTQWRCDNSDDGEAWELTFEEDKLALAVLVDGVYFGRQAPPEDTDEHGVPWHHRVISHSPKPVVLKENKGCR